MKDKNGIDVKLAIPVFYILDDDNEVIYDLESMKQEFDKQLSMLPQYPHDRDDLDNKEG